jgi:hypothetical protein
VVFFLLAQRKIEPLKTVAPLIHKVEKIETLLSAEQAAQSETERWFNLDDLCKYHSDLRESG